MKGEQRSPRLARLTAGLTDIGSQYLAASLSPAAAARANPPSSSR
jgi:hypothetical protein